MLYENLTSRVRGQGNDTCFVTNPFANRNDSQVTVIYKLSAISGNQTHSPTATSSLSKTQKCSTALAPYSSQSKHTQSLKHLNPQQSCPQEGGEVLHDFISVIQKRLAGSRLECKRPLCAWDPDANSTPFPSGVVCAVDGPPSSELECGQSYRGVPARLQLCNLGPANKWVSDAETSSCHNEA